MKADFTRNTFKPEKYFTGVRMQQGRVQLDSDWNEQLDIQAHLDRVTERDVIGPCGVPLEGGGFQIGPAPAGDLSISPGRFYADGILVEFLPERIPFVVSQADKASPQVQVGIWTPDSRDFAVGQLVLAYDAEASATPVLLTITAADSISRTLTLATIPSGQGDLGALLKGFAMPRLLRNATYNTQPYYSDPTGAKRTAGTYLAYLDIWERLRTPLEEPVTREVALGGTDTAARSQLVWQVKLWPVPPVLNQTPPTFTPTPGGGGGLFRGNVSGRSTFARASVFSSLAAGAVTAVARQPVAAAAPLAGRPIADLAGANVRGAVGSTLPPGTPVGGTAPTPPAGAAAAGTAPVPPSCLAILNSNDWASFVAQRRAWMSAQSTPQPTSNDPCIVPPRAGFRRLENQLYRVEVHTGGPKGTASFKWSRENGSVVTAWNVAQSAPNELSVASLGRDSVLGFAAGQWVELTDDNFELQQTPGILVKLSDARMGPDGPVLVLDPATSPIDFTQFTLNPKIRRWDQADATQVSKRGDIVVQEGAWINLEGGVQIKFQPGGTYTTGDYWIVPARTITGDVEWFIDDTGGAIPQPSAGVVHHYCHLALLQFSGSAWTLLDDCRQSFPPAAALGIHVSKTNWSNDDTFPMDVIVKQGLQITLDAPPEPNSVSLSSVIVELERPVGDQIGEFRIVLAGSVRLQGNVVIWQPEQSAAFTGLVAGAPQVRLRVTLKGRWIWGTFGDHTYYVDGQALGEPDLRSDGKTPRVALNFPSGSGEIASDFESWLWLVPAPQLTVASLTLNPTAVMTQGVSSGTVTLSAAPPTGGASVTLVSNNPAIAAVPASVFVPAGSTSASFNIQAGTSSGPATITASLGSSSMAATLTVVGLQGVTIDPTVVLPGGSAVGTVTFTANIPTGGPRVVVALGASPAVVQLLPAQLVIAPGTNSASFRISVQGSVTGLLGRVALPAVEAPAPALGPAAAAAPGAIGTPPVIRIPFSRTVSISASFGGVTVHTTLTIRAQS